MFDTLRHLIQIIGTETPQQSALTLIVFGTAGLGVMGLVLRTVSKIKAAVFIGG